MTITFKALHESDFPLLLKWLKAPHVKKWWDQDVIYTMGLVKEKFGKHIHGIAFSKNLSHKTYAYIICVHEEMVGYNNWMCDYKDIGALWWLFVGWL